MDKSLSFLGELSQDDKLTADRVLELVRAAESKYISKFTFFLDEHQRTLSEKVLASVCFKDYMFFGGYEGASRTVLGTAAPYTELGKADFPISAFTFTYRPADRLTHRDFLGCLMSLGIERSTVGDILVTEGKTALFVSRSVSVPVSGITKVGRVGVKVSEGYDESVIPVQEFVPTEGTVSSLRLDCVLSLALRISREKAAALIRKSGAEVNYTGVFSCDARLEQGDVFSVRGFGKFRVEEIGAQTAKGRFRIKINKYA